MFVQYTADLIRLRESVVKFVDQRRISFGQS